MSNLSDYLENKVADHLFGKTTFTAPSTLYLALYTTAPTDTGGGTEVSGSGYSRVSVTNNTTNFPAAVGGLKKLATESEFPEATGSWGTVVAVGVLDASSGGNLLIYDTLTTSRTVASGDQPKFAGDALTIQFD